MTNSFKLLQIWNPKLQLNGLQSMISQCSFIANYFLVSPLISPSNGRNKKSIIKLKTSLIRLRLIFIMIIPTRGPTAKSKDLQTILKRRCLKCQDLCRLSKTMLPEEAQDQTVSTEERPIIQQRRPQANQTPQLQQEKLKKWLREGKFNKDKTLLATPK